MLDCDWSSDVCSSDPLGDGYAQGDAYPKGGYRPAAGVQRGSVADMPIFPGDPLTPGVGATKDAQRLDRSAAPTLMKIPVLPISAADALPLLAALDGPMAPAAWRGALPIPYKLGPGGAKVHLKLAFDWKIVPAYDVVAKLPGRDLPDQWIVRGNHHDAWVNGATDPLSGMVAVLEEARAVGELAKAGQRPRRTIVYAGWDGEEPGLLGSTEWVEFHAEELRQKAVAYINTDSTSRGFLDQGGSHSLERLMGQIGRDVMDPVKSLSVAQRVKAATQLDGSPDARREARERRDLRLDPLGSGSDYTPFLQHLGIAALNLGFGGEDEYGQYHSIYDSFDHYVRFMDPDFTYGVTLAKVAGRATLRLANADTLPFDFTALAETVGRYVDEVEKLAESQRKDAEERNRRLDEGTYAAVDDVRETWVAPPRLEPGPYFNFAPLKNAHAALAAAAKAYDEALANQGGAGGGEALDRILLAAERTLTRPEGLPGRPWFKHHLYAPGQYTGYGVKTLPRVREPLEIGRASCRERVS
jgi:N-acetylated-alpha-linked acidic dipeptidase